MCFGGGGGPSQEEKQTSVDQRIEADDAKRQEAEKIAEDKKQDIQTAIEDRSKGQVGASAIARRSGLGQRSLLRSGGGGGFLGRFSR